MPLGVLSVDTNRLWKGKLRVGSQGESRDAALVVPQRYAEQTQHTPAPPPPPLPKDATTPLKSSLRSGAARTTSSSEGQLMAQQRSPSTEQRRVKLAEALETHKSMEEQLADQHRLETEEERQYQAAKETQKKKEEQEKRIPPNREALSTMHDYRTPKVVLDGLRDPPPGSSQSARNSSAKSTLPNSRGNSRGDPASARGLSQDSTSVADGLKSLRISSGPAVIQNPLAPTREERNANRKAAAKKEAFTTGSSDDEDQDFVEGEEVRSSTADDEVGEKGVSKMIQSLKPGFTQVKLCSLPRKEGALVNPPSATTSRRTTHHTIPGSSNNSDVISPSSDLGGRQSATDSQLFSVLSQTVAFGGSTGSGGAVPGGASAVGTHQQQSSVQSASVTSGIEVFESGRESTASAGGGGGRYSSIGSSGTTSLSVVPPPDVRRGTMSPPQHHQHFGGAAEGKVITDDSQSHHPFGVPGGSGVTTPEGGLGVADKNLSASNIPYRKSSSKPRFRTEGEKEAVRATMSFRRGTKLLHPQDFQNLIEASSQPAVYTKIADLGMEGIPRPVEPDDDGGGGASALLQQYRKEHATTRQHQRPSITGATILSQTVSPTAGDPDVESRPPQQSRSGGEKRLSGPPRILTSPGAGGGPLSSSSQQTRPSTQQQSVVTITDKGEAKVLLPQQRFLKKGTRSPGSRASSRSKSGAVVDEVKLVGLSSGSREVVLNVMEKLDTWGKSQEGYVPHRKGKLYIPGEHKVHIPKKPPSIPIKALTPRQEVLMQEKKHAFAMSQIKVAVKGVVTNSKPVMFKTPYIAADRINLIERPLQAVEDFVFRPKTVHYVHPPHSAQLESLNSRMNKKDFLSLAQKEHHQRRMDESNKVLSLKERHALITSGSRGDPALEELEEEKRRRRQEELNKDPIQSLIQEAKKRRAEAKRRRRDSDDDYY